MVAALFRLPRPRNPLLRALSVVLALVAAAATVFFGILVVIALAVVGAVFWATRQFGRPRPAAPVDSNVEPASPRSSTRATPPGVIEGEFVVVREPAEQSRR